MRLSEIFKVFNVDNIFDAISIWEEAIGYLEKETMSDLGDFTDAGKIRNAGDKNYTLYWKWYKELTNANYQGQAYCAGSGSTMFASAFGYEKAKKLLCGKMQIYCPDVYNAFKKAGRTFTKAKVGDIVLYWSDSLGRYSHFGIVTKLLSNGYVTWEANTSSGNNTVVRNGGATCRKSYTYGSRKEIFCRPDYEACGISTEEPGKKKVVSYPVHTDSHGIKVLSAITVRKDPEIKAGNAIGTIKYGEILKPTKKAFDDTGRRWFYIPEYNGWCSTINFEGWVCEETDGNQWWYLLKGNQWYAGEIAVIDGKPYAFGDNGYMCTAEISAVPDAEGVLHLKTKSEIISN